MNLVSSSSSVSWCVVLWSSIGILSVLVSCTVCYHEKRGCLDDKLCLHQRRAPLSPMRKSVQQSKDNRSKKKMPSVLNTSLTAFKIHQESRTTGNVFNWSFKKLAVDTLASDIVEALILKEVFIGIHVKQFKKLVTEGLSKLNILIKKYIYRGPNTEEFLENVSATLDTLKIGSEVIADDLVRIQAIESNPSNAMNSVLRFHRKFNLIKNSYCLRNSRNSFHYRKNQQRGYKINSKFFVRQNDAGELCYGQSANNKTRRKCFSKVYDWWQPIIRVRDELKYCELWMLFLEELSYKTESVEFRLDPVHNSLQENMLSNENLTETFSLIIEKYSLYSVRTVVPELVKTVNDNRLKCLYDVLKLSRMSKPACFRLHNMTYVESPYVLMSDVLNCSKILSNEHSSINVVSVVSGIKFFIDQDFLVNTVRSPNLMHGKGFHLIVLSPDWIVLSGAKSGSKKIINLNGRKPPSYPPVKDNADGNPGLPGEEGGSFYAFGRLLSGGSISIELNGGDGGNGQDGGTSQSITMACYESQASACTEYFCCHGPSTKFVFPGKDGGRQGIGAGPGHYKIFVFASASRNRIEFHQEPGIAGEGGHGKNYSTLKEGLYPDAELLKGNNYQKFERYDGSRWCHDMRVDSQHVYLPLSEEDEIRFSGKDNAAGTPKPADEIKFGPEKSVPAIRRYRRFSRKHLNFFNVHKNLNFIANIDDNYAVRKLYDTLDIFWEFKDLGEDVKPGYFYREVLKLSYHSLSIRAIEKVFDYTSDHNQMHLKLPHVLSLASQAKLIGIANPFERFLTVNMKEFLEIEKSRILEIKSAKQPESKYKLITRAVSSYNSMIKSSFRELGAFINKTINMEMDFLEAELGKSLEDLLDKIKGLQNNGKLGTIFLKDARKKLENHIVFNRVAFFSRTVGEALSTLWSVGAALSFGVDMTNAFSSHHRANAYLSQANISDALAAVSSNSALRFRKSSSFNLKGFQRQLKIIQVKLNEYTEAFPKALETINYTSRLPIFENKANFTTPLSQFPPKDCTLSYKQLLTTEKTIRKLQTKVSTVIHADVSEAISVGISGTEIDLICNISGVAMAILQENVGVFNTLKEDEIYTEEIARAINNTQRKLLSIQNHIFKMQENLIPDIHNLILVLSRELAGQQSLALMTIRNKIQSAIRDVRLDIEHEFLKGTRQEAYFIRSIQCLRDAAGTLGSIYGKIDAYRDMSKLEKAVNDAKLYPEKYNGNLSNAFVQKSISELVYSVQGDILLKRQSLIEGAFRTWKFPIVDPILCSFENLSAMYQNFSTYADVLQYVQNIEKRIDDMIYIVNQSKTSIVDGDKYILQASFLRSNGLPFYKWANSSWWQFIASIFDGQSTFLYSNHFPGPHLCEVVKFRQISISFGSVQADVDLEADLKEILNDYLLSLTHVGRSYYLFANQTFVINSEKLEFIFSFEVGSDGLPKTRNVVYDKFIRGDITLSPYSMWFIALKPLNPSSGFKRLSKFSKKVDMYLEGVGSCVRKNFAVEGNYVSPTCEDAEMT